MTINGKGDALPFKPKQPAKADIPTLPIDLDEHTITDIVHQCNARSSDARLKEVMSSLVQHLHDFAREIRLTEAEWMAALLFLTEVGQNLLAGATGIHPVIRHSRPVCLGRFSS